MQNTTNLSVDFQSHIITVSNSFLRRSRVVDSPEYSTLLRLMQELPGFQLETRRLARPSRTPYMPGYNEDDDPNPDDGRCARRGHAGV